MFSLQAFAQADYVDDSSSVLQKSPPANKFGNNYSVGGNFSILFGSVTLIDLSPQISSEILPKIHLGAGLSGIYYNDSFNRYSTTILGGRLFGRWFPLDYLFTHLEFEILNGEWIAGQKFNITSNYLGIGYRNTLGSKSGLDVLLLYNLTQSEYSPYSNPTFRIGFMVGL